MRYRKRPVVVDAVQFTGYNLAEIAELTGHTSYNFGDQGVIEMQTVGGTIWVRLGDWVIKGDLDEIYACKSDVFEAMYEPVED